MLGVTILGNNSALPAFDRHPTAQVVTLDDQLFLVDCGEGTQVQLSRYKIRWGRINYIFISHLHGDHYFGLIGLINSFGLLSHQQDLHIYGPAPLQQIIELQLSVAQTVLPFQLHFHIIHQEGILAEEEKFVIRCFRTNHRIECYGFHFQEKKNPRKINPVNAKKYEIPSSFYDRLQNGEDYTQKDGTVIKNEWVTDPGTKPKSYAYCADTKYDESIIPHLQGADMIYHETTYLDNLRERADFRFHSTTKQAAIFAQKAGVKKLLIGHFSSKYDCLDEFEREAREIFPNTELALEGVAFTI